MLGCTPSTRPESKARAVSAAPTARHHDQKSPIGSAAAAGPEEPFLNHPTLHHLPDRPC
jgi:hypothetical protein